MRFAVPDATSSALRVRASAPVATALIASCVTVAAWVALAAWMNHSQLLDSLEQFVWGRGLEWGYWKHPPLTSWLMWAGLKLAGPTPLVTYGLAALLTMVTIACTTRWAQLLAGEQAAVYTALLLVLHYGLTRRAQVYNHNTVLLACAAALALTSLLAVRSNRPLRWMLAGAVAGLSMLAKYQAAVPIAGVLLAITVSGQLRRCLPGLALAVACAIAVFLPHALWAVQHDFETLRYVGSYIGATDTADEHGRSLPLVVMQLKYYLPAMGFSLLLWAAMGWRRAATAIAPAWSPEQRSWLAGLVLLPVLVLVIASVSGVRVQSHWGMQATQFLSVGLALLLQRRFGPWGRRQVVAWLLVQSLALAVFVGQGTGALRGPVRTRDVRDVEATELAREVLSHWAQATRCPLHYLSGSVGAAGMVAAYSHQDLRVLEDGDAHKSPWIDLEDMRARGFVVIREQADPGHEGAEIVLPLRRTNTLAAPRFLVLQLHLPAGAC